MAVPWAATRLRRNQKLKDAAFAFGFPPLKMWILIFASINLDQSRPIKKRHDPIANYWACFEHHVSSFFSPFLLFSLFSSFLNFFVSYNLPTYLPTFRSTRIGITTKSSFYVPGILASLFGMVDHSSTGQSSELRHPQRLSFPRHDPRQHHQHQHR